MKLKKREVEAYKQIYFKYNKTVIDDDSARKNLARLIRQVEAIYVPITNTQYLKYSGESQNV